MPKPAGTLIIKTIEIWTLRSLWDKIPIQISRVFEPAFLTFLFAIIRINSRRMRKAYDAECLVFFCLKIDPSDSSFNWFFVRIDHFILFSLCHRSLPLYWSLPLTNGDCNIATRRPDPFLSRAKSLRPRVPKRTRERVLPQFPLSPPRLRRWLLLRSVARPSCWLKSRLIRIPASCPPSSAGRHSTSSSTLDLHTAASVPPPFARNAREKGCIMG